MTKLAPFPVFPELQTERLWLRAVRPSDAPAILAIHGNLEAMRYFGSPPMVDIAQARRVAAMFGKWHLKSATAIRWGIERKGSANAPATGQLIGTCGFHGWNKAWRRALLGYELSSAHVGQGCMQEALRAVLQWAFVNMPLNRVEALIRPENAASLATVRALGFTEEARLRQIALMHGEFHDMLQFVMLSSDFAASRAVRAEPKQAP